MKQNSSASKTLTKQDLLDALKDFRTITKQDIHDALKEFRIEIQTDLDEMRLQIENQARERHSEILTRFDGWAGELETAREDRTISTKQLGDHEKRIQALEKAQN